MVLDLNKTRITGIIENNPSPTGSRQLLFSPEITKNISFDILTYDEDRSPQTLRAHQSSPHTTQSHNAQRTRQQTAETGSQRGRRYQQQQTAYNTTRPESEGSHVFIFRLDPPILFVCSSVCFVLSFERLLQPHGCGDLDSEWKNLDALRWGRQWEQ